jgi:hypothetical protein
MSFPLSPAEAECPILGTLIYLCVYLKNLTFQEYNSQDPSELPNFFAAVSDLLGQHI